MQVLAWLWYIIATSDTSLCSNNMRLVIRDIHGLMEDSERGKVLITCCHGTVSHADCFWTACTRTLWADFSLQTWAEEQGSTSDIVFQHSECIEWLNRWLNLKCVTRFHKGFVHIWASKGKRAGFCFRFHTKESRTNSKTQTFLS